MEVEPETKVVSREADDPDAEETVDSPPRGRVAGRYELLHKLGHGGMATVYLARSVGKAGFEKLVAVKVIHPHLASETEFVEMFLDEARIAARIHHPHVVEILDLGEDHGTFFMVLEYVEGETLSTLIRQLRQQEIYLPLSVVLQIVADALEGLAVAHDLRDPDGYRYGLVHRDVSPQNLLVGLDGWVKVMDFGIMKAAGKRSSTLTGQLRGKLAYMSPEQARGEKIDRRTDLFAMGTVLWELCTNQRLFAGQSDTETLDNVTRCHIPDLQSIRPSLPAELREVILRALARDPDQRYDSAEAMLADIRRLQRLLTEDTEPRRELARIMQSHFEARAEYARAAVRSSQSDLPRLDSGDDLPTRLEPTPSSPRPSSPSQPLQAAAESQTAVTAPVLTAKHWTLWLLLPLIGAAIGTAIVAWQLEPSVQPAVTPLPTPPAEPQPSEQASEAPPQDIKWVFNTDPSGATVILNGEVQRGETPMDVWVPRGGATVEVRFELEGHEAKRVKLVPVASDNYHFRLRALPEEEVATERKGSPVRRPPVPPPRYKDRRRSRPQPDAEQDQDERHFDPMPDFDNLGSKDSGPDGA